MVLRQDSAHKVCTFTNSW